jgi:hypothetical protein
LYVSLAERWKGMGVPGEPVAGQHVFLAERWKRRGGLQRGARDGTFPSPHRPTAPPRATPADRGPEWCGIRRAGRMAACAEEGRGRPPSEESRGAARTAPEALEARELFPPDSWPLLLSEAIAEVLDDPDPRRLRTDPRRLRTNPRRQRSGPRRQRSNPRRQRSGPRVLERAILAYPPKRERHENWPQPAKWPSAAIRVVK